MASKINNNIELVYAHLETLSDDQQDAFVEAINKVKRDSFSGHANIDERQYGAGQGGQGEKSGGR